MTSEATPQTDEACFGRLRLIAELGAAYESHLLRAEVVPFINDMADAYSRATPTGRYLFCVYERIDDETLYPVTAYEPTIEEL
jgi:hypothetical protein